MFKRFKYFGSGKSIANKNGKPHGIIWYMVCTSHGNFRLFPVGYIK